MTPFATSPWPKRKLGELCRAKDTVDPRKAPALIFRYVDIASVSNTEFSIVEARELLGSEAPSRARKRIREGDIIVATTRPYLRSIARVPLELDGEVASTGFCVLRPGGDVVTDWIFYAVLSDDIVAQLTACMRGANYPAVTDKDVLAAEIPTPPLSEQKRIVAQVKECMEHIDEIRALREEGCREASALLPSSLAAAFEELVLKWNTVSIDSVLIESRYGTSRKCNAGENAIPVLRIPNVVDGQVGFEGLKYCNLEAKELSRLILQDGDLLVVRTNGSPDLVGRCAVFEGADKPFAFASYLIRLRVNPQKADPRFVAFFLASTYGRDAIASIRRTSAGQYNVNSENLRAIKLPLPPVEEQKRIASHLSEQQRVARAIAVEQASRMDETDHLRAAVLRKAFAGEL